MLTQRLVVVGARERDDADCRILLPQHDGMLDDAAACVEELRTLGALDLGMRVHDRSSREPGLDSVE